MTQQNDWVPEVRVRGTAFDAGRQMGEIWAAELRAEVAAHGVDQPAWWRYAPYAKLMECYAPHLPDLYRGMAKGAGVPEESIATRAPMDAGGCTTFAVAGSATRSGHPIGGQSKDVSRKRGQELLVLALELTDSPHSALTLTYPGWLFGHGFVTGGCTLYRNSLFLPSTDKGMPFTVWGMLALHCPTVEDVMRITHDYGVAAAGHTTIADEVGGIIGMERGKTGTDWVRPEAGIYAHANAVVSDPALLAIEHDDANFTRQDSIIRRQELHYRLAENRGRLTAPLCYAAMMCHVNYPTSLCRHQSEDAMTAGYCITEPTLRRMYAGRGPMCEFWPREYMLGDGA